MKQKTIQLPCAIKEDDSIVPIEKAKPGEKGYLCPGCRSAVIVRKGEKRRAHFAHKSVTDCQIGYQTALHLLAKEILLREKSFRLPNLSDKYFKVNCFSTFVNDGRKVFLSYPLAIQLDLSEAKVTAEVRLQNRIPDILIECKGCIYAVEIYVTHKVSDDKIADLRKAGISIIEIDLSEKKEIVSESELTTLLCNETDNKKWLYHPRIKSVPYNIKEWENSINNGKYILYTKKKLFKHNEEIAQSIKYRPIRQNELGESIVAECPRKFHYSQSWFYAMEDECESCPLNIGPYESYPNSYTCLEEKGIVCQELVSGCSKHSLDDFKRWLKEYAKEEAKTQTKKPVSFQPNYDCWEAMLRSKANSFNPDLAEPIDSEKHNSIIIEIASQTHMDYFFGKVFPGAFN